MLSSMRWGSVLTGDIETRAWSKCGRVDVANVERVEATSSRPGQGRHSWVIPRCLDLVRCARASRSLRTAWYTSSVRVPAPAPIPVTSMRVRHVVSQPGCLSRPVIGTIAAILRNDPRVGAVRCPRRWPRNAFLGDSLHRLGERDEVKAAQMAHHAFPDAAQVRGIGSGQGV